MTKEGQRELIENLRSLNLNAVKSLLRSKPELARAGSAVVEAARLGWTKALELLVRNGADLNASFRGYRPLHALIQEVPHGDRHLLTVDRVACLKWMLEKGADPEQLGGFPPIRALTAAAFVGEPLYIAELRRAGALVDGFVSAALGDFRQVEKLLKKDPSFATSRDSGGLTALHCSAGSRLGKSSNKAKKALIATATLLLDSGAEVKARVRGWGHDLDAVYFAVSSDQRELFVILLDRGADPTEALPSAVWRHDTEFARLALAHGANLDSAVDDGKPLLNQMIRWGQIKQTLWLLEQGASPNISDENGWTAVHQAASRGNETIMKAVLNAGGNPTLKDKEGRTPIDVAIEKRRPKIAALLRA